MIISHVKIIASQPLSIEANGYFLLLETTAFYLMNRKTNG